MQNARKGEFSRVKVRNRRAVELGSGMGLAGMAFALLGAEVTLTDITDSVLTLLRRNVENNITPTALRLKDAAWAADCVGKVRVEELDWGRKEHYSSVSPPFDYVIAADCVYSEVAVPLFLATVLAMVGPLGVVIVCNEFRSQTVHDLFVESFSQHFSIRKVSMARMDKAYQHPLIHIYLMKRKKGEKASEQGLPY
jgi:predicted nicotinamide N-methyase